MKILYPDGSMVKIGPFFVLERRDIMKKFISIISTFVVCFAFLFVIASCANSTDNVNDSNQGDSNVNPTNPDNPDDPGKTDSTNPDVPVNPGTDDNVYYTVVFKDYDGTILQTSSVKSGDTPAYNKTNPTRENDDEYSYTFNGWQPTISKVKEDTVYTATYLSTHKSAKLILDAQRAINSLEANEKNFSAKIGDDIYKVDGEKLMKNETIYVGINGQTIVYNLCDAIEETYIKSNIKYYLTSKNSMLYPLASEISVGRWDNIFTIGNEMDLNRIDVTENLAYITKKESAYPEFKIIYAENGFSLLNDDESIEFYDIGTTKINIPKNVINDEKYIIKNGKIDVLSLKTLFDTWFNKTNIIYEKISAYVEKIVSIDVNDSGINIYVVTNDLNKKTPILSNISFDDKNINDLFVDKYDLLYDDFYEKLMAINSSKTTIQDIIKLDNKVTEIDMNLRAKYVLENDEKESDVIWAYENAGIIDSYDGKLNYKMICLTMQGNCYEYNVICNGKDSNQFDFVGELENQSYILSDNYELYDDGLLLSEIKVTENLSDGGSVFGSGIYKSNEKITIGVHNINEGFKFAGWYKNNRLYSEYETFDFIVDSTSIEFEARYVYEKYKITINNEIDDLIITGITNGNKYNYGTFVTLVASNTSDNYIVWNSNDGMVSVGNEFCFNVPSHDVIITVKSLDNIYNKNGNNIYFGLYPQTKVDDTNLINELNNLSGELPTISNIGKWIEYKYVCNIYGGGTDFMYYQDIDYDNDGTYDYRGVYFTQYRQTADSGSYLSNYNQPNNGYSINTVYWFIFEPIEWDILKEKDGELLLISKMVLDEQCFLDVGTSYYRVLEKDGVMYSVSSDKYDDLIVSSNYEYSDIRKYLNDELFSIAFDDLEKSIIKVIDIDNGDSINITKDKLFLLSKGDATAYYTSNIARMTSATDYAVCQGAGVSGDGMSSWALRTQALNSYYSSNICSVYSDGSISNGTGSNQNVRWPFGVRPALWISLL